MGIPWDGTGMNCYGMGRDRRICPMDKPADTQCPIVHGQMLIIRVFQNKFAASLICTNTFVVVVILVGVDYKGQHPTKLLRDAKENKKGLIDLS